LQHKEHSLREQLGEAFSEEHKEIITLREEQLRLNKNFEETIQLHEQAKADAVSEIETKQKVIASLTEAFAKQKSVLCETKLAFNFDRCVKQVRASLTHFGASREHRLIAKQSQWPYFEALKNPKLELFEQE